MPWELDGNNIQAGDANNTPRFLGTQNNRPLSIKTRTNVNNSAAMHITPAPDANNTGNIGIGTTTPQGRLDVRGAIRAGNSDVYFTRTDHNHTGIGNANGFAAIENAADYGALMILGRAGTPNGRSVRLWDYLEVNGTLRVTGPIQKLGGGFRIDHPLDSDNKYLQHSFVESPDMKNVYDGVEQLDEDGSAWVELPEWFGALNQDYRYQLTATGEPAPGLHIAEEISENRFKIAGGKEGMKVSWMITGIRKDEWAEANRLEVEVERSEVDFDHHVQAVEELSAATQR